MENPIVARLHIFMKSECISYSISSHIRHTCSIHVLSKILMRIYHIIVETHISPQSKITEEHQKKKIINNMFQSRFLNKINSLKVCLIGDEIGYMAEHFSTIDICSLEGKSECVFQKI